MDDLRQPGFLRLLGKAHPKWWCQTDLVEFDPKGVFSFRPYGETRKNEFSTQLDVFRQPGVFRFLVKPSQNGGMITNSFCPNSIQGCFFVFFAPMGKVEKTFRPDCFERNWTTFVNPAFCAAGGKSLTIQNGRMKPDLVEFDPKGVFSIPPMGKVELTSFERNRTTFVNPAFFDAWESPPKMVV